MQPVTMWWLATRLGVRRARGQRLRAVCAASQGLDRVGDLCGGSVHACSGGVQMNYIELAKQVGAVQNVLAMGRHDGVLFTETELKKFAALVKAVASADEREECARIAELAEPYQTADLIRARGTT